MNWYRIYILIFFEAKDNTLRLVIVNILLFEQLRHASFWCVIYLSSTLVEDASFSGSWSMDFWATTLANMAGTSAVFSFNGLYSASVMSLLYFKLIGLRLYQLIIVLTFIYLFYFLISSGFVRKRKKFWNEELFEKLERKHVK